MRFHLVPTLALLLPSVSAVNFYVAKAICSQTLPGQPFSWYPAVAVRVDQWDCGNIDKSIVVGENTLNPNFSVAKGVPSCTYNDKLDFYKAENEVLDYYRSGGDGTRFGRCYKTTRAAGKVCVQFPFSCVPDQIWECFPERGPCS